MRIPSKTLQRSILGCLVLLSLGQPLIADGFPFLESHGGSTSDYNFIVDDQGSTYMVAEMRNEIICGEGPTAQTLQPNVHGPSGITYTSLFVAKLDSAGKCLWIQPIQASQQNLQAGELTIYPGDKSIYVAGFFGANAATKNNVRVTAGNIDSPTFSFDDSIHANLYVAKFTQGVAEGDPPVTVASVKIIADADSQGWCRQYARLGGMGVATVENQPTIFIGASMRDDCDPNVRAWIIESGVSLNLSMNKVTRIANPGEIFDLEAANPTSGAVVALSGRDGTGPFIAKWSPSTTASNGDLIPGSLSWTTYPASLTPAKSAVLRDLVISPDGSAITVLHGNNTFRSVYPFCLGGETASLLRLNSNNGTAQWSGVWRDIALVIVGAPATPDDIPDVKSLAEDEQGRYYLSYRRRVGGRASGATACAPADDSNLRVSRLEFNGTSYDESWQAVADSEGVAIEPGRIAVSSRRLYVTGAFNASRLRFGSEPYQPDTAPTSGTQIFQHRLSTVNGDWFKPVAWTVGQTVSRPALALAGVRPEALDPEGEAVDDFFHWDPPTGTLFALRELADAAVQWSTGTCSITTSNSCGGDGDCGMGETCNPAVAGEPVESFGRIAWPFSPQLHIAGAPVDLKGSPSAPPVPFESLLFSEDGASSTTLQGGVPMFHREAPGYSVLRYAGPILQVVKTEPIEDFPLQSGSCIIGTPISVWAGSAPHSDPSGRTGYPLPGAPIDAIGTQASFNPTERTGPLVAVNVTTPQNPLRIAWYAQSPTSLGRGWPVTRVEYVCQWPTTGLAPTLYPDSLVGSDYAGGTPIDGYPLVSLYVQNDPTKLGFNPNDEHALLDVPNPSPPCLNENPVPGWCPNPPRTSGVTLFAMRRQDDTTKSQPYVILKTRNSGAEPWTYRIHPVAYSGNQSVFTFQVEAGDRVPKPYPLSLLAECGSTVVTDLTGTPSWRASNHALFARADGQMRVDYFYGPSRDFDPSSFPPGGCQQWLPDAEVRYQSTWPAATPLLVVGETLTSAKNSLPDMANQDAIQVIFEGSQSLPSTKLGPRSLVRLFDPLATRWVPISQSEADTFLQLKGVAPADLGRRLVLDLVNLRLGFTGLLESNNLGSDPLLFLNVLSTEDKQRLTSLTAPLGACSQVDLPQTCRDKINNELFPLTRSPYGLDNPQNGVLVGLQAGPGTTVEPERHVAVPQLALSAGAAKNEGYVTLVLNENVAGKEPELKILRVQCGVDPSTGAKFPYPGSAFTVDGADAFGTQFGLRHSADFGGEPEGASFDWRRFLNTQAIYNPNLHGTPDSQPSNWTAATFSSDIQIDLDGTLPEYIGDSYFFVRYSLPGVCDGNATPWSGDPASSVTLPQAKLASGWVKRVIESLNAFHQRIVEFHITGRPVATYVSMIRQAGPAYEGPVSFRPAVDSVDDKGLIETYETVLRRALELTLEASGYQPSAAIDNALLLVSARISDLHMLLGNEAWADSIDPTIGFGTQSGEYGSLATTIHAFQNQLPSLLDEELALLRGADRLGLTPTYNRMVWNFTTGEGEAAYAQAYAIEDQNGDFVIDAADARKLYPQGHGDAWGHYLTSMKGFLRLLRSDDFLWVPRAEAINVLGSAQFVDYRDERRLAAAAAARARTGSEILSLTYRSEFVQDPAGQWQGYLDPDRSRAWGVDDWARRASQGALFDWTVANALLPDHWETPGAQPCALLAADVNVPPQECPQGTLTFDPNGQIDRTKVPELSEIAQHQREIQQRLDEADQGLNPLGLARGAVPFDIDPALLDPLFGESKTHFEQVYERAEKALVNAVSVFDYANRITESLRRNQDSLEDFRRNLEDRERDIRNRLIEIFGRPYLDDVGGNGFYPNSYPGPDIYHYYYTDARSLQGVPGGPVATGIRDSVETCVDLPVSPASSCEEIFPTEGSTAGDGGFCSQIASLPSALEVCMDAELGVSVPLAWTGNREAEGDLQRILSDNFRALAALKQSQLRLDSVRREVELKVELLETVHNIDAATVRILEDGIDSTKTLNDKLDAARQGARWSRTTGAFARGLGDAIMESFDQDDPTGTLAWAPILKSVVKGVGEVAGFAADIAADQAENLIDQLTDKRDLVALETELSLEDDLDNIEAERLLHEIEILMRQEPAVFLEIFDRQETLRSTASAFRSKLSEGLRLVDELEVVRRRAAADVQQYRYEDLTFRLARNDALQKYRAQYDLAARYAFLAAQAYDYETNLLGSAGGAGQEFLTDIVRHRSVGQVIGGHPVPGSKGLADALGRMDANFDVLKGQLGFNNPQTETNRFSLRHELFRMLDSSDEEWETELKRRWVANLWDLPEFRRLARPFAEEGLEPEPGLVIRFRTTVTSGLNFFGWPLGGQDSSYDSSRFATKIRSVGTWFENYDASGLSNTPRVYLIPAGADILRAPSSGDFTVRQWNVVDQVVPVPFPVGEINLQDPEWIPLNDTLSGELGASRRLARFRAYHDDGFDPTEMSFDSRLIGRSVWNSEWLLIIPGETLRGPTLAEKIQGLRTFIETVDDVKLFFQTYSYPGANKQ
ncbi:MAG: hypothetical protein K8J08_18835 [Thermoanaerobaculia bacterium]|nr:hypothetical protein [Thermoanaerobaculia bacterium]